MKKIIFFMIIILSCVSLATAGITLKGLIGYGFLLSPSIADISGFSGYSQTKGGLSFNAQGLFGDSALKFGAEVGYLSLYSWSYEIPAVTTFLGTFGGKNEASLSAIPILGLVQYTLGDPNASFRPFLQGGLGFYMTSSSVTTSSIEASSSELDFGIKLGVGGDIQLSPGLDLDISANYYNIFVTGGASTLNIEAGIAYKI